MHHSTNTAATQGNAAWGYAAYSECLVRCGDLGLIYRFLAFNRKIYMIAGLGGIMPA
jgi:hypothetical protein